MLILNVGMKRVDYILHGLSCVNLDINGGIFIHFLTKVAQNALKEKKENIYLNRFL